MIKITDKAREKIALLLKEKNNNQFFFRVGVKGGGCSGMAYTVEIDNQVKEKDQVFEEESFKVVSDPKSLLYLSGIEIDFNNDLVGGGFQFNNPNASGSCGCGTSFSV